MKNLVSSWGSPQPKILFVGFCAHSSDVSFKRALYSRGGQMLRGMTREAGIDLDSCHYATILPFAAPLDMTEKLLVPAKGIPADLKPWLKMGTKYLKPEYFKWLAEFQKKIEELQPNLIVTLGAEACQLLTGEKSLLDVRGTVLNCSLNESFKVLPVTHPAMMFMQPQAQVIFSADLIKIKKECEFKELRRIRREITIPELVEDCQDWWRKHGTYSGKVTVDIETIPTYKIITCVGIATSPEYALTIPFYSKDKEGGSYWSPSEELYVLRFLYRIMTHPNIELNFQGGAYDVQWLYEQMRIPCINYRHDTMLLHHSLYPEMKKGLAFLASLYTSEPSWKGMVNFKKDAGDKADG